MISYHSNYQQRKFYHQRQHFYPRQTIQQRKHKRINDKSSSFHLKKIYNSQNSIGKKFFIVFAYLTCAVLFLWQAGLSIQRYLKYPVGTIRTTREEKITYLPSISICNNLYRFKKAISENEMKDEQNPITETDIENVWNKYGIDQNKIRIYRPCNEYQTDALGSDVNITSFFSLQGSCIDVTLGCPLFQSTFGMDIEILEHNNIQYVKGYSEYSAPFYNIYPHVSGELDIRKIYKNVEGIWKAQLAVVFEKREIQNTNSRSNPCISIDEHIKCHDKCFIQVFERYAKCKVMSIETANLPYCTTWTDVHDVLQLFDRWQIYEGKFQNCSCIRSCKEADFKVDYVIKKERGSNTLKLEVLMDDAVDEIVSEYYMYPFSMLISDLSGIIGFFLGISLFSLLQILKNFGTMLTVKMNN